MKPTKLEERVAALEKKVAEMEQNGNGGYKKDWRRTLGMFSGDEVMKSIDEEARQIREADREKARKRRVRSAK